MAKNDAELQALEQPKSRNEEYLNFLCGRAVDINSLPDKPYSRVEEYLEYLCHNRGQGGGGGQPLDTSFIGATIQNNIITFQRQNGTTHDVNLEDIIPNATKESIKEITVVGKELVLTKVDNSELRVDLTQLLSASNISFNGANSGLGSTDVQGAIDEVKNLIDLLQAKNTTTHFVADNTEFEQLKNTTTFVSGDIVYVINSNGVVDYTNTDVDNDGKAISLIYDEKITGFRVLSRDSEEIVLKASSVTVEPTINGLNNVQEVLDYLEEDKASLNKNNVFTGINTFNEINLIGKTPFVESNGISQSGGHKNEVYCGRRDVSTHKNNPASNKQYVSAIKIRIVNTLNVGDTVTGVCVAEIEKRTSRLDDIVGKTIVFNGTFIVEEDIKYGKCIYVPVQKEYTSDTYFLIGQKGARELREYFIADVSLCVNELYIDTLPQEGLELNHTKGNGWLIEHALVDDDINVREKLSQLVTSVNQEVPVSGNVIINAEHIPYNNATSNLLSTDVQKAIDELKRDMVLLDTSDIHIVSDSAELTTLLGQGTLKKGDLIYIINSNGVVDFNGNNVGNGGDPVAMIYDSDITISGNKLRVFSKFDTPINISADIVTYNDQVAQLGADNVQDAIVKLNEKFVSDVIYDEPTRTLKQTKNGQETDVVTGIVTKWGDLEYTTQSRLKNVFDKNTQVEDNKRFYFDHIEENPNWKIAKIPCQAGDEFTIIKNVDNDSSQIGLFDVGDVFIQKDSATHKLVNGRRVYRLAIPNNVHNVSYFVVSMQNGVTNVDEVMIFSGNVADSNIPTNYIPFADGASVIIDSNEVALSFDKTGTSLTSVTVHSAIKELDKKVVNTGTVKRVNSQNPNSQGEVTVNAEHINYDDALTNLRANNVQDAIKKLKEDMALIDGAEIFIVPNKTELDNLLNQNVVRHGDLIYVINSTGVVDFDNQPANGGNPVAMIFDDSLNTGNKLRVFSKFSSNVNVSANNVSYNDATTNLGEVNVQGAIGKLNEKIANAGTVKSVNSVMPQVDGDVVLRGENINVEVLFTPGTVRSHLEEIKTLAQTAQNEAQTALLRADNAFNGYNRLNPIVNSNTNEITALKRRSQYRVGDVITTFRQSNNNYTIDNVEFIYLGRTNNTVSATTYPQLAQAFGLQSSTVNFTLPQIQDIERFFNVNQRTYQKHFIVAKIN